MFGENLMFSKNNFYDEEVAERAIVGYSEEEKVRCREIMKLSCGNMQEVANFLAKDPEGRYPHEWKLAILNTLQEKDYIVHLGDGASEVYKLLDEYPQNTYF